MTFPLSVLSRGARMSALGLVLAITGCMQAPMPSESVYRPADAMTRGTATRCRVLETRQITLGAETRPRNRYARAAGTPEEQAGTVLGAVAGAFVGQQIGDGDGRRIATALGTSIGAAAGRAQGARMARARLDRPGVEYSVLRTDTNGRTVEEVIVQASNPGDRVVPAGASCRIVSSPGGLRVMPADHLPTTVAQPRTTRFR